MPSKASQRRRQAARAPVTEEWPALPSPKAPAKSAEHCWPAMHPLKVSRQSCTSNSVSTEASTANSSDSEYGGYEAEQLIPRGKTMPAFEASYPPNLIVKNTFFDFSDEFAEFAKLRKSSSAPDLRTPALSFSRELCTDTKLKGVETSTAEQAPQLGSPSLPTIGSLGHSSGQCKPCSFFWKTGCSNGTQCSFCHLCDAGEKKRRQKDKKSMLRKSVSY